MCEFAANVVSEELRAAARNRVKAEVCFYSCIEFHVTRLENVKATICIIAKVKVTFLISAKRKVELPSSKCLHSLQCLLILTVLLLTTFTLCNEQKTIKHLVEKNSSQTSRPFCDFHPSHFL